jgi:hypothetical protein
MLDDAILDRLHEDLIRAPTWPPRPRNSRFAKSLVNRQKQLEVSRFAWRLVVELPPRKPLPYQWEPKQYLGRARYGGTALPPISYEDYKAGRHFPPSAELMNIGRFADAGPVEALAGVIAILLGFDGDGIAHAMDANRATDLALSAMAITRKGGVSDMGAHQFSVTNQSVMSAPPPRFMHNELLSTQAQAEAEQVQEELACVLREGGPAGGKKAIAAARIQVPGYTGPSIISRSRSGQTDSRPDQQKVHHATTPGADQRRFTTCIVCNSPGEHDKSRAFDAEIKILEEVSRNLPANGKGFVYLACNQPLCPSCTNAGFEFASQHRGVQLIVFAPVRPVPVVPFFDAAPSGKAPKRPVPTSVGGILPNEHYGPAAKLHKAQSKENNEAPNSDIWKY